MQRPDLTVRGRAEIACWTRGQGPAVLVLHGFPDHAIGMLSLAEAIAASGASTIVPALPGYHPSEPAPNGDYSVDAVARDLLAVLDALEVEKASVVGHDWGGLLAYHLAAAWPERIDRIVALAVPHPSGFRIRRRIVREQQSAAYAWILAYAGDRAQIAADPSWLTQLAHWWSPALHHPQWDEILAVLTRPEVAEAVCAWYRCDFDGIGAPTGDVLVPATVLHGVQDGCIGPAVYDGTDARFAAGVNRVLLPTVGHWLHLEQPDEVARLVLVGLGLGAG